MLINDCYYVERMYDVWVNTRQSMNIKYFWVLIITNITTILCLYLKNSPLFKKPMGFLGFLNGSVFFANPGASANRCLRTLSDTVLHSSNLLPCSTRTAPAKWFCFCKWTSCSELRYYSANCRFVGCFTSSPNCAKSPHFLHFDKKFLRWERAALFHNDP